MGKIERPSKKMRPVKLFHDQKIMDGLHWENCTYYGVFRAFDKDFPIGGGQGAIISITALDETARHDWREFQQIKNELCGDEWEAVELYPAESRLRDPSNRFYLWAVPEGTLIFGWNTRKVLQPILGLAPQRGFA